MDDVLRLLILEDSQDDADLIILRLKQEGFNPDWGRVESEAEYLSALDSPLDIIIADYSLPQYTGLRALEQLKERGLDIPFILISGTMGEEIAVQAIKQGATDYLLKDRPMRLGAAVRNALQERQLRKEKVKAEQTTQRIGERIKILYRVSQEIARVSLDLEQVYSAIHLATQKLMPAEAFVITLVDEDTNENVAVYLIDREGRWPEKRIPANQGLTGYICATGKPFLTNNFTPGDEIQTVHFGEDEPVRSILGVPLTLGKKVIGMLSAQSYQSGAYSSEDQSLLEMLSAHAAVAIQNARLHTAIRNSEEKYRLITENMRDMVWLMDMNLKTIYISPSAFRSRGFTIDEINHMSLDQHITPESLKRTNQILAEKFIPEKLNQSDLQLSETVELEFYRKDGTTFWSENTFVVIRDEEGNPEGVIGVGRDITERKQSEHAVRESEAKYRSLFENVPDGVYRTKPNGEILAANPALVKMLGFNSLEELSNTNPILDWWVDAEQREQRKQLLEEFGELSSYEVKINDKNHNELIMLDNARIHQNEQGEVQYYQGTLTDITGRIQRQRELEALSTVGAALRTANLQSEIIPVILEQAMNLAKAQGAAIASVDPYSEDILLNVKGGKDDRFQGIHLRPGEGITGKVFQTGKTFVCDDVTKNSEFALKELFQTSTAAICMPLTASGKVISVLWIMRKEMFEEDELKVLEAITDMTANALQRASLFEQTTLQLQRLTSLQAIDHAITGSMDLNVTLNILLDQVISQLNVHSAGVLLFNATSQTLEYSASKGFSVEMLKKYRMRRGGGLASQAATKMEVVSCELNDCSEYPFLAEAGYVTQIAVPLIAKGQVKGVLELFHRDKLVTNPEWRIFFETLASQAAISIDNATLFADVQRANIELSMSYDATIEGWSRALDLRDQETEGHTQRVVQLTLELANTLGINGKELMHVRRGALLHDIGKMAIPDSILLKPGPLSEEEWVIMRQHPVFAYQLLHPIPYLRQALDIPHCHHEKWDGSGYPRNLKGTQIPLAARIFAIVDVYDAITSDRPYRSACSKEEAMDYIRNSTGTHFEPKVVEAFFKVITTYNS